MNDNHKEIESICIVRLSAIGDVTHVVPIIHTVQRFRPDIKITWIIGTTEYKLVGDLENVEFIQFDKSKGASAYSSILSTLRERHFGVVLAMQVSLRANLVTAMLRSSHKIGYDLKRSKDFHSLVINERIEPADEHVVDSFFRFIEKIGIRHKLLDWSIPIPADAEHYADTSLPKDQPILAISPCSSHTMRNWHAEGYAEVANHAYRRYQMQTVLLGGHSAIETEFGDTITERLTHTPINLIGKDTLKKLVAVIKKASLLLSPDSGPAHIATCVNTPVIALHAASNHKRSGPYLSQKWCIDRYSEAAELIYKKPADQLKWGTKIEKEGVMDLIKPKDVIMKLDQIMQTHEVKE